jgi:2-succinyl-5-enolpyruvyl-6-hydroxy-3-cyclohexene-1-carboxylate synthase
MSNPYSDEQVQANRDAIATPEQQNTFEGRSRTLRDVDQLIKAEQHMIQANRAAAGRRVRQYRMMSSKGF